MNFLVNLKQNSTLGENINLNSDLDENSDKNDQSASSTTTEKSVIITLNSTDSDSSIMLSTSDQTSESQTDSTAQLQAELYAVKSQTQSYMKTHSQPEPDFKSHDDERLIIIRQIIDDLSEKNIMKNSCQQISTNQQFSTTD